MKVLIVEDSIFVQKLLTKLIVDHIPECEIQIANNGEQGYNLFKEFQPDFITTDLLMPGLNGQEMLRMIRETDSNVKIIILSADIQKTTRDEVEMLGISGFLNKPLTAEKATTMIQLIQAAYHAE
ncbi:response regulator [Paenibacillus sp. FSL H7-0942]|jgi:two-component system chemotaxis response regulator CheY|uniref:Response regulator n=2 Tax=Paenibacillus TaxID=44249 RepID=A0ABD8B0U6_PAEAM|nr:MULTISPECIES: response regulator [Paenibacillus]APO45859.1 response regulator [Paenibacillus xylanexedens]ETT35994.1 response regulator receiver protein [Paenibacillus sp. FSL R5-192]ETT43937.1 response regulator receiver protein [Paenibacillus sp. FSL H7-689]MBY0116693.1 response regulator [Paenibacillus xylanexedens]MCF7754458.1 response regulator [Paenibacillus xylanexedens]